VVSGLRAGTNATIDVKTSGGGAVRLLVLTQGEVDRLTLPVLEGSPHLLLADAQTFSDGNDADFLSTGDSRFSFAVFPHLSRTPSANLELKATQPDGLFQQFEARAPKRTMAISLKKLRDAQPVPPLTLGFPANTPHEPMPETFAKSAAWSITVRGARPSESEGAFLRIRARGDVARLFAGTTMLDDHFLDGSIWDVGLNRFSKEITAPLVLTVLPLRSDAPIYLDGGVAAMTGGQDQVADVLDVSAVPQYRLHIHTGP
jgi:hypothetical protein